MKTAPYINYVQEEAGKISLATALSDIVAETWEVMNMDQQQYVIDTLKENGIKFTEGDTL
jgi:chloramphenicol 3-O-phosphotransferase